MFDSNQYLIPLDARKGLVVAEASWALDEMEGLFTTLGGKAVKKIEVPLRKVDPKTYIGLGKLEELATEMQAVDADVLLIDYDLSPSQMKNIEKITKCLVLDRSGIILEIFSRHAQSRESKLQVELARMQYLMPRLAHLWSHFERQTGSGGSALKGKGMGEKQIEVDRRLVKDRISHLKKRIEEVDRSRRLHRESRKETLQVALVGYTNAGKSTLLNALTHSDVLVEDALFATLDSSVRLLTPKVRPAILAIDTVGFIDRLPHNLVASFRSTLSAVLEADLILHVMDASSSEAERHFNVTMEVLKELSAEKIPMALLFNKIDAVKNQQMMKVWAGGLSRNNGLGAPLFVSAMDPTSVNELRTYIIDYFSKVMEVYEVMVPYADGKTMAKIHEIGQIEQKKSLEQGTFVKFKTMDYLAKKYNLEKFKI